MDSKEIKPVNLKGNQPWILISRADAEAEAPILWPPHAKSQLIGKDPDAGKGWEQKGARMRWEQRMRWLDGITNSMDKSLFEQTQGDDEGRGGLACCSTCGHKGSDTTYWLNNNSCAFYVLCDIQFISHSSLHLISQCLWGSLIVMSIL